MHISDLQEDEFPRLKIGDIDPRNGKKILSAMTDGSGYVVRSRYGDIWNVKYGEPDPAPTQDPTPTPTQEPEVTPVTPNTEVEPQPIPPAGDDTPPTPAPDDKPDEIKDKCGPDVKAKIKQQKTFNAAYKMAQSAGCPDFDWCQIVDVPGSGPQPAPATPGVSNPMGDFDPTMFSGDPTSTQYREDVELEQESFVPEPAELHRMRDLSNLQVLEAEKGGIPEIKAPNKEAAIAIARKKGIKKFRFCGKYKVKAAKKGSAPQPVRPPVVPPKKTEPVQGVTTNPMGDFDPTAFSGDFTKVRR